MLKQTNLHFFLKLRCITTTVENLRVQMHQSLRLTLDIVIFVADSANAFYFLYDFCTE